MPVIYCSEQDQIVAFITSNIFASVLLKYGEGTGMRCMPLSSSVVTLLESCAHCFTRIKFRVGTQVDILQKGTNMTNAVVCSGTSGPICNEHGGGPPCFDFERQDGCSWSSRVLQGTCSSLIMQSEAKLPNACNAVPLQSSILSSKASGLLLDAVIDAEDLVLIGEGSSGTFRVGVSSAFISVQVISLTT
jgi:hypothetical protein